MNCSPCWEEGVKIWSEVPALRREKIDGIKSWEELFKR